MLLCSVIYCLLLAVHPVTGFRFCALSHDNFGYLFDFCRICLLDVLQLPKHAMGIPVSFGRGLTVVATDRFPGVSVFLHASGQDLCPAPDVAAGITKRAPPLFPEGEVPAGVDLHDPEIVGTVFVPVDSPRLEVGLHPGYGPKDLRINAVFLTGLVKAELLGMCCCRHHEQHTDAKDPDLRHESASRNTLESNETPTFFT